MLELLSLISAFDVLNLILTIVLVVAAVFIMIDRNKNKALLEKAKADTQNAALASQASEPANAPENKTE